MKAKSKRPKWKVYKAVFTGRKGSFRSNLERTPSSAIWVTYDKPGEESRGRSVTPQYPYSEGKGKGFETKYTGAQGI